MENGLALALIAAFFFALCVVVVRQATTQAGESFTTMLASIYAGALFFTISLFFTGEWSKVAAASWGAIALLAAAGVVHFIAGRLLSYDAYRLIGANKATPFVMTNPFYTILFSVLFLKESLTIFTILGVLCIFVGAASLTTEKRSISEPKRSGLFSTETKGILIALAGAVCWGISPVLIKPAVVEMGSPFAAAFISYAAASIIISVYSLRRHQRERIARVSRLGILKPVIISAVFASAGQLFSFMALAKSPASLVSPIIATNGLFIFFLSFLLNRKIELFTPKIIIGIVATVAGAFLIFH
jgi:drug/metabolite transporter (DMT)-like permease